jgi:hypothetical protein
MCAKAFRALLPTACPCRAANTLKIIALNIPNPSDTFSVTPGKLRGDIDLAVRFPTTFYLISAFASNRISAPSRGVKLSRRSTRLGTGMDFHGGHDVADWAGTRKQFTKPAECNEWNFLKGAGPSAPQVRFAILQTLDRRHFSLADLLCGLSTQRAWQRRDGR